MPLLKYANKFSPIIVPLALLVLFTILTDPYKLPLALLVIPFILVAALVYQTLKLLLRRTPLSSRKARLTSVIVTCLVLLLVLLQSIRQLSLKDFLILAALTIGIMFYLRHIDL